MSKHAPIIALQAARARLNDAEQNCTHWDYEAAGGDHPCCRELADAESAHRWALKKWRSAQ